MRLLFCCLLLCLAALAQADSDLRGDPEAARAGWAAIEDGALVIDVRSPAEYDSGHLPGAVNIPHDDVDALKEALGEDRDRSAVLYCGSGRRAGFAIEQLKAAGYRKLVNASGLDALEATRP